jgi:hypothetical protein
MDNGPDVDNNDLDEDCRRLMLEVDQVLGAAADNKTAPTGHEDNKTSTAPVEQPVAQPPTSATSDAHVPTGLGTDMEKTPESAPPGVHIGSEKNEERLSAQALSTIDASGNIDTDTSTTSTSTHHPPTAENEDKPPCPLGEAADNKTSTEPAERPVAQPPTPIDGERLRSGQQLDTQELHQPLNGRCAAVSSYSPQSPATPAHFPATHPPPHGATSAVTTDPGADAPSSEHASCAASPTGATRFAEHLLLNIQHALPEHGMSQAAQQQAHCQRRAAYARRCCSKASQNFRPSVGARGRRSARSAAQVAVGR